MATYDPYGDPSGTKAYDPFGDPSGSNAYALPKTTTLPMLNPGLVSQVTPKPTPTPSSASQIMQTQQQNAVQSLSQTPTPSSSSSNNPYGSWYLSNWGASGDKWSTQPTLTINGKANQYSSPSEYINQLNTLKSLASQYNPADVSTIDKFINEFNYANSLWKPAPVTAQATAPVNIPTNIPTSSYPSQTQPKPVASTPSSASQIMQTQQQNATQSLNQPTQNVTPQPVQNPVTPTPNTTSPQVGLREIAESQGKVVGWDAATGTVTIDGIPINTSGLTNVNGRFTGTTQQITDIINVATKQQAPVNPTTPAIAPDGSNLIALRDMIPDLAWDAATGNVTINGKTFTPQELASYGLTNVNGRWSGKGTDVLNFLQSMNNPTPNPAETQPQTEVPPVQTGPSMQDYTNMIMQQTESDKALNDELASLRNQLLEYTTNNTNDETINALTKELATFKGSFSDEISNLIKQTMAPFEYDVSKDNALQDAIKFADKSMMEEMNKRGLLSSSMTSDSMVNIRKELMPKYQELAYQKYNSNLDRLFKTADFMNKINEQDYSRYKDYATAAIKQLEKVDAKTIKSFETVIDTISKQIAANNTAKKDQATAYRDMYAKALDTLDKFGYVTNDIASILNMPVGTPSGKSKAEALARFDTYNKIAVEQENKIKLDEITMKNDLIKFKEEAKIKADATKAADTQAGAVGTILSQVSNMSAEEAMEAVKAQSQDIIAITGGKGYTDIITALESRKQKEIDNVMSENASIRADNTAKRQVTATENAAQKVVNAAQQKDINDKISDYSAIVSDEMYDKTKGLDYTKFASFMEKLVTKGEPKEVIDKLSRKWNFDENSYKSTKVNANFAGLLG